MKGSYRVTKWGDGSFTVDFLTKNGEGPVELWSWTVKHRRMSCLKEAKKAIEQHKEKLKADKIASTFWYDENTGEFY